MTSRDRQPPVRRAPQRSHNGTCASSPHPDGLTAFSADHRRLLGPVHLRRQAQPGQLDQPSRHPELASHGRGWSGPGPGRLPGGGRAAAAARWRCSPLARPRPGASGLAHPARQAAGGKTQALGDGIAGKSFLLAERNGLLLLWRREPAAGLGAVRHRWTLW